jgi:Na+/H+-dicarboxylate symporter
MKNIISNNRLLFAIILGVVLGGVVGSLWPHVGIKFELLGKLFLDALKMIVLPLIIVSVTLSIMKVGNLGSLGLKTLVYYTATTAIAVFIGIVVVTMIHPGDGLMTVSGNIPDIIKGKENMGVIDILTSIISPNLFSSAANYQILPLIVASVLFGIAFGKLGTENQIIINFFTVVDKAIMMIVHWIIILTPIGIFGLISYRISAAGGGSQLWNLISEISKYFFTVIIGLCIHGFIILPAILYFLTKRNPLKYLRHMSEALVTAFSTASSAATLPLTITNVKEAKVSDKVGRFVLPLGATINMDGTALYEAVAVIFIAQSYGIDLAGTELVIVFITATLAAIGAASIPQAGLVTMVIVLQSVGLPMEGIGLILAVDWLLDRFRTTINVWGDSIGAAVIDDLEKT